MVKRAGGNPKIGPLFGAKVNLIKALKHISYIL